MASRLLRLPTTPTRRGRSVFGPRPTRLPASTTSKHGCPDSDLHPECREETPYERSAAGLPVDDGFAAGGSPGRIDVRECGLPIAGRCPAHARCRPTGDRLGCGGAG